MLNHYNHRTRHLWGTDRLVAHPGFLLLNDDPVVHRDSEVSKMQGLDKLALIYVHFPNKMRATGLLGISSNGTS